MLIVKNKEEISKVLQSFKSEQKSVGFVPTMGALHKGHLMLVEKAKAENDVVVCSIFVNPTQFNDSKDFEKYPRTETEDLKLLEEKGCDIVYLPTVEDIYAQENDFELNLNGLDNVMEGAYRPGHFKGVVRVVKRFFEIVKPNNSYFGLKDFQQYLIIKCMAQELNLGGNIIGVETLREPSGLAMSSRNMLLSESEKHIAAEVYTSFKNIIKNSTEKNLHECIDKEKQRLSQWFVINYLDARSSIDFSEQSKIDANTRLFFAGKLGNVRLIDNFGIFN